MVYTVLNDAVAILFHSMYVDCDVAIVGEIIQTDKLTDGMMQTPFIMIRLTWRCVKTEKDYRIYSPLHCTALISDAVDARHISALMHNVR